MKFSFGNINSEQGKNTKYINVSQIYTISKNFSVEKGLVFVGNN